MYQLYVHNTDKYIAYYTAKADGDLPGYSSLGSQYGAGLGGIFCSLFRLAFSLFKNRITVAAPYLKTAAKNFVSDVITNLMSHSNRQQEGSEIMAMSHQPIKRPPGQRKLSKHCKTRAKDIFKQEWLWYIICVKNV